MTERYCNFEPEDNDFPDIDPEFDRQVGELFPEPEAQVYDLPEDEHDVEAAGSWFSRISLRKTLGTIAASAVLATGGLVASGKEATADTPPNTVAHHVYRTDGDGVWLHDGSGLHTPKEVVMPEGAEFDVQCFNPGGDLVNGNALWLTGFYNGRKGSTTDYHVDTHWKTTQDLKDQGIPECGQENQQEQPQAENGGSVLYSPWGGTDSPATYTMSQWGDKYKNWAGGGHCNPENADDFPEVVDNKRITTLAGWSIARLGPLYFLETASQQRKSEINYILLIDPGSRADYENNGCDQMNPSQSKLLADWLSSSPNNHLTILAGAVTKDRHTTQWINGVPYAHQGIQEKLFAPDIRGHDIANQVLVCNYDNADHHVIFNAFKGQISKSPIVSESDCPANDGLAPNAAWRP